MNTMRTAQFRIVARILLVMVFVLTALPIQPAAHKTMFCPCSFFRSTVRPSSLASTSTFVSRCTPQTMPDDFAVTVNGEDAAAFFGANPP